MKKTIIGFGVWAIVLFSMDPCWSFSVIVQWNQNTEPDLAGYRVYHGTDPYLCNTSVDAGMTTSQEISGLIEGVTYYFAVTAYNAVGDESYLSDKVFFLEPEAGSGGSGGGGNGTGGGSSGGDGGSSGGGGGGCFIEALMHQ